MASSLITAISWERVHLSLTVLLSGDGQAAGSVQFVIADGKRVFPVKTTCVSDRQYRIDINVTAFRGRDYVPNGTWRFVPLVDGRPWPPLGDGPPRLPTRIDGDVAVGPSLAARYDLNEVRGLDEHSRVFLFADNHAAYVVNFGLSEHDEHPEFLMRTYLLGRRWMPDQNAAKPPLGKRFSRKMLPDARRRKLVNLGYRLSHLINPPRGNRILFASERRASIEGNLARVHGRMIERGLHLRYKFRYSFRIVSTISGLTTLRAIYMLATSDIVLIDDYFGLLAELDISPETKIIQLWHAGSGFKSIGYSRFGTHGSAGRVGAHRKYTYAITGSKNLIPVYAEAFGIEESAVVATGLPRIDTFLNKERTQQVIAGFFEQYPNFNGKRIILFAPTFRGRGIEDAYYDYSRIDFGKLYEVCGETSVVLFRMHHFVTVPVPIPPEYADRLLGFESFPETNDLLHLADVLITDYSSVIYEFSLLGKPMLFYAYDKDTYSAVHGFHRDYDATAPGKVCTTFDELVKALQNEDYDMSRLEAFRRENFDYTDTCSADRVIDWLILDDPTKGGQAASESACPAPATAALAASPSAANRGRKP
jgi:CDP-ribitol ribitolphosphotransferase / teichoic acid ribitol-phosphate polymerase